MFKYKSLIATIVLVICTPSPAHTNPQKKLGKKDLDLEKDLHDESRLQTPKK